MCQEKEDCKKPMEKAMQIVEEWREAGCGESNMDSTGSYTGMTCDGEAPEQDADDL